MLEGESALIELFIASVLYPNSGMSSHLCKIRVNAIEKHDFYSS